MSVFTLTLKNLGRKKLRTLLTGLSIVIAFILFAVLGALNHAFGLGVDLAGADRLITMHKVSFIQPLPYSYVRRVEGIDGVELVNHHTWFGAYYQDPKQQFALFPTEMETLRELYPAYSIPDAQWQSLLGNRTGLLIGQQLANSYGWSVGDQVPLRSSIYPQRDGEYGWQFQVEAIFDGAGQGGDEMQAYMHYEYFNQARAFGRDTVGWLVTRIADPDRADAIAAAIDERFANSATETKTTTEKGWAASFAAQLGNIGLIVRAILAAVFFTLLLVTGNTMAQAVRERTSELGVMKTLGFGDRRLTVMVLGESLLLSVSFGLIGLALGWFLVTGAQDAVARFLPGLAVPPETLALGVALTVALGLFTGGPPAWRVMRLSVVNALGRR